MLIYVMVIFHGMKNIHTPRRQLIFFFNWIAGKFRLLPSHVLPQAVDGVGGGAGGALSLGWTDAPLHRRRWGWEWPCAELLLPSDVPRRLTCFSSETHIRQKQRETHCSHLCRLFFLACCAFASFLVGLQYDMPPFVLGILTLCSVFLRTHDQRSNSFGIQNVSTPPPYLRYILDVITAEYSVGGRLNTNC